MTAPFKIAQCPENRKAMISFTFDDGTKDHLSTAAPELEKRNWRGTFFINTRSNDRPVYGRLSAAGLRELAARGHEIGAHTMTHRELDTLQKKSDYASIAWEIAENITALEESLGIKIRSYTAPFGENPPFACQVLAQKNILNTPPRIAVGGNTMRVDVERMRDDLIRENGFSVICFHGVAPGVGSWDAPSSADVFPDVLDLFRELENDVWFDTFSNNAMYRLRAAGTTLRELAPGIFMLELDPVRSGAYGRLYLKCKDMTEGDVMVNNLPVRLSTGGLFTAAPGDVISLA